MKMGRVPGIATESAVRSGPCCVLVFRVTPGRGSLYLSRGYRKSTLEVSSIMFSWKVGRSDHEYVIDEVEKPYCDIVSKSLAQIPIVHVGNPKYRRM